MKTRIFILMLSILLIICILVGLTDRRKENSEEKGIIEKGYQLFGSGYCRCEFSDCSGCAFNNYICKICGKSESLSFYDMSGIICTTCKKITGRCLYCGKIINNNKDNVKDTNEKEKKKIKLENKLNIHDLINV